MSARIDGALDVVPDTSGFFGALADVDDRLRQVEEAEWQALFAPPVTSTACCSCGAVFERRDSDVRITDAERAEAIDAVARVLGRPVIETLDGAIVGAVIAAVNRERGVQALIAMADFGDAHAGCGGGDDDDELGGRTSDHWG